MRHARRKLDDRTADLIRQLHAAGRTKSQIAKLTGRRATTVRAFLLREGLAENTPRERRVLALELTPRAFDALTAAAARRQMRVEELAGALVASIIRHGSIDHTLRGPTSMVA